MAGKLIVFEGTDGSGKSTQFRLLCQALERQGTDFRRIVFPRYDEPSSALIRMYLGGAFGSRPGDVSAFAASSFYAVDRYASYKQDWGAYYEAGGLVLSDRYTTSNAIHQGSKLPQGEREEFLGWLGEFEYGRLGLPRPDAVLWMDMPIGQAVKNLRRREADTHTTGDIHEVDTDYLAACYETACQAAEHYGWRRVPCMEGARLRTEEEIHEEIMACLRLDPVGRMGK